MVRVMTDLDVGDADEQPATTSSIDGALSISSRGVLREVAHILRSPIGAIVMLTEALRERGHQMTEEQRDEHLAIVYRAALGVSELAGDLLTLVEDDIPDTPHGAFSPRRMLDLVAEMARDHAMTVLMVVRVMLGLTLRALLRTHGGLVRLRAMRDEPGSLTFDVVRRGATAVPENGVSDLTRVFRMEPETGDYTLSADGLGLAATDKLLRSVGSSLVVEATSKWSLRLAFSVPDGSAEVRRRAGGPELPSEESLGEDEPTRERGLRIEAQAHAEPSNPGRDTQRP